MAGDERFPETSWTLLARARRQGDEGSRAREEFAQRYYRPVREFLFVLVQDAEQAQELTQEFFNRLSRKGTLFERADREKGSFRGYLRTALRRLVIDGRRFNRCEEFVQIHPDQGPGGWDDLNLPDLLTAEAAFHRAWVEATLAEALTQVRTVCQKRRQEVHLHLFEARYLGDSAPVPSWQELGARYGMDQRVARERADTVARHFRLVLRRMLRAETTVPVSNGRRRQEAEAAIDEEIEALLSPLQD